MQKEKSEIIAATNKRSFYEGIFGELSQTSGNGWIRKPVNCPFHADVRASFSINLESGRWNCFSQCGGGSIVDFVMRMQGMDFKAALAYLADYSGLDNAPNPEMRNRIRRERRDREKRNESRRTEIDFECLAVRFLFLPWEMKGRRGIQWNDWTIDTRAEYSAHRGTIEWLLDVWIDFPEERAGIVGEWELRIKILIGRYKCTKLTPAGRRDPGMPEKHGIISGKGVK